MIEAPCTDLTVTQTVCLVAPEWFLGVLWFQLPSSYFPCGATLGCDHAAVTLGHVTGNMHEASLNWMDFLIWESRFRTRLAILVSVGCSHIINLHQEEVMFVWCNQNNSKRCRKILTKFSRDVSRDGLVIWWFFWILEDFWLSNIISGAINLVLPIFCLTLCGILNSFICI